MSTPKTRLLLDASDLAPIGTLAWITFLGTVLDRIQGCVLLHIGGMSSASRICDALRYDADLIPKRLLLSISGDRRSIPNSSEPFIFITGSEVLSRKLLRGALRLYLRPQGLPRRLNPGVYWMLKSDPALRARWDAICHAAGIDSQTDGASQWLDAIEPAPRRVSLITSVYNGDDELPSFLANMSSLIGYAEDEHWLIRAGSPGKEHDALIDHVTRQPSSVYMNLTPDPGLYETWNQGIRLATGRYVSNANLDDRRAPEQLDVLVQTLDEETDLAAASTPLRITEDPSTDWPASEGLPLMFGDVSGQRYGADDLFKSAPEGQRSRNLPHCMPVWRRALHGKHGWFNERRYGPSADWEFWLRCGVRRERFRFLETPLGLYRKSEDSYWRRNPQTPDYDRRIAEHYFPQIESADESIIAPHEALIGRQFEDLKTSWSLGSGYEAICRLIQLSGLALQNRPPSTLAPLLAKFMASALGIDSFSDLDLARRVRFEGGVPTAEQALWATVELIHAIPAAETTAESDAAIDWNVLGQTCDDLAQWLDEPTPAFVRCLVLRRQGRLEEEAHLLRTLHTNLSPKDFWYHIQRAYRFCVPLDRLAAMLGVCQGASDTDRSTPHSLWFYPHYRGNAYQGLIYESLTQAGCDVRGIEPGDVAGLETLAATHGQNTVLHLHWLNAFFKGVEASAYEHRIQEVKSTLLRLRGQGIKVWWTVHNRVSHECANVDAEMAFRRWLAGFVDRLFLQHPLAEHLLEWLPDSARPELWEHPRYPIKPISESRRRAVRHSLGVDDDETLIIHFGKIRPYKGLAEYLPALLERLKSNPKEKLLIAGSVEDPDVRKILDNLQDSEQVIVKPNAIPADVLDEWLQAADIGFLCYRNILTSGTLHHMQSAGLPVWVPRIGLLPAELAAPNRSAIYRDADDIEMMSVHPSRQKSPSEHNG